MIIGDPEKFTMGFVKLEWLTGCGLGHDNMWLTQFLLKSNKIFLIKKTEIK